MTPLINHHTDDGSSEWRSRNVLGDHQQEDRVCEQNRDAQRDLLSSVRQPHRNYRLLLTLPTLIFFLHADLATVRGQTDQVNFPPLLSCSLWCKTFFSAHSAGHLVSVNAKNSTAWGKELPSTLLSNSSTPFAFPFGVKRFFSPASGGRQNPTMTRMESSMHGTMTFMT